MVLVIDDHELSRDLVVGILRLTNAGVQATGSVREGLEHFQRMRPDVVICDLAMPEEDGFAFVRAVRALPSLNATPIIALTAFARPEDRQSALDAGFDAYMKKPVDPEELAQTVLSLGSARR